MNSQYKGNTGSPKPIMNANNDAKPVTGYETCQGAATDRKDVEYTDVQNSGMPPQEK